MRIRAMVLQLAHELDRDDIVFSDEYIEKLYRRAIDSLYDAWGYLGRLLYTYEQREEGKQLTLEETS